VYGLMQRATDRQGPGTVYTFALGGTTPMPEFVKYRMEELVAGVKYDPAHVKEGTLLYVSNCVFCHGVPGVDRGGNIPNLGYMKPEFIEHLDKFVFVGPSTERGMPDFTGKLSPDDVEKIKAFIQGTADAIRPKK
jgi:quinohemoprotein ethanol dehydrogenase